MTSLTSINAELLSFSTDHFLVLKPYILIIFGAILSVILSVLKIVPSKYSVYVLTILVCIFGIVYSHQGMGYATQKLFNDMLIVDSFSSFFNILFFSATLFTALISFRYLDQENLQHPEYFVLLMFSAMGMMFMVSSLDILVLFIALELMSLTVYTLVGFRRADRKSNEAALKYFILGGAASVILMYGASLLYGLTSSLNILVIYEYYKSNQMELSLLYYLGSWLVIVGFLFKIAAVPFHMWMPDVYEGAPAPITGFMTTGIKAASFAALIRIFISFGFASEVVSLLQQRVYEIIWVLALLTMLIGNIIALQQINLKRILAYSSIAHTGYILVGFAAVATGKATFSGVLFYLVSYVIMNLGAFAIITVLSSRSDEGLTLNDISGVSKQHPLLAAAFALFLFSMSGIPPSAGFIGKFSLFSEAIQTGVSSMVVLVLLAVLCSAISVFYYLRVIVFMYMKPAPVALPDRRVSLSSAIAIAAMFFLTLYIGITPQEIFKYAKNALFLI